MAELRKNGGHSLALDEREDDVDGAEEIQSGHPSQEGDDPLQIQEGQEEEDQGLSELEAKAQDVNEKKWKEFIQERKALHVRNITFGVPLKDRSVKEVIKSTSQIYARARAMRLPITRVHTDRDSSSVILSKAPSRSFSTSSLKGSVHSSIFLFTSSIPTSLV